MTRLHVTLALLAALSLTLAACAGETPSGASREPGATGGYDRLNDVDRFPQPRGSSPYLRP
jgi:hypothetical protein